MTVNKEALPGHETQSSEMNCPSCGRFVGAVTKCPYCGAKYVFTGELPKGHH